MVRAARARGLRHDVRGLGGRTRRPGVEGSCMKRTLLLALALVAGVAAPSAQAAVDLPLPTPGFASDNVEWLGNVPLHTDSAGRAWSTATSTSPAPPSSRSTTRGCPESPTLLSTTPMPQMPYFAEEDVDTNGEVLLVSANGTLNVVDVRDKTAPSVVGTLGVDEHTISCVLDCTWAYGSEGTIVDLRDPRRPEVAGNWTKSVPGGGGSKHDVTEVSPGHGHDQHGTMALLDARTDPAHPSSSPRRRPPTSASSTPTCGRGGAGRPAARGRRDVPGGLQQPDGRRLHDLRRHPPEGRAAACSRKKDELPARGHRPDPGRRALRDLLQPLVRAAPGLEGRRPARRRLVRARHPLPVGRRRTAPSPRTASSRRSPPAAAPRTGPATTSSTSWTTSAGSTSCASTTTGRLRARRRRGATGLAPDVAPAKLNKAACRGCCGLPASAAEPLLRLGRVPDLPATTAAPPTTSAPSRSPAAGSTTPRAPAWSSSAAPACWSPPAPPRACRAGARAPASAG